MQYIISIIAHHYDYFTNFQHCLTFVCVVILWQDEAAAPDVTVPLCDRHDPSQTF